MAIALSVTGSGLFSVAVSLSAGYVISALGWRAVFWLPAVFIAIVVLLIFAVVPESPVRSNGDPLDVTGASLLGLGVTGVLLGVSLGATWGWTSWATIGSITLGVVVLIIWTARSLRISDPMVDPREFRSFPFVVTFLLSFLGVMSATWFLIFNPIVVLSPNTAGWGLGMQPEQASIITSLFLLGAVVGGLVAGRLLSRMPAPSVGIMAAVLLATGFVVAFLGLSDPVMFGIGGFLIGGTGGFLYAVISNLVPLITKAHRQTRMAALMTLSASLGQASFPILIFALMNSQMITVSDVSVYSLNAIRLALLIPAGVAVVLLVLTWALRSSRQGAALRA